MPKQATDPEVLAMSRIVRLINPLTKSEQERIIRYLQARYAQIEFFPKLSKTIDAATIPETPLPCPHDKDDTGADPNANENTGNSDDPMPWEGEESDETA